MQADHKEISRLVKTARGQLDGILNMIEQDRYCIDISNQLLAAQAILSTANQKIIAAHLKNCLANAADAADRQAKIDEIIALIDKMSR